MSSMSFAGRIALFEVGKVAHHHDAIMREL